MVRGKGIRMRSGDVREGGARDYSFSLDRVIVKDGEEGSVPSRGYLPSSCLIARALEYQEKRREADECQPRGIRPSGGVCGGVGVNVSPLFQGVQSGRLQGITKKEGGTGMGAKGFLTGPRENLRI